MDQQTQPKQHTAISGTILTRRDNRKRNTSSTQELPKEKKIAHIILSTICKHLRVIAVSTSGELSPSCPRAYTLKMYSTVGNRPEKVISVWSGEEK